MMSGLLMLGTLAVATSCSQMQEDLPPCHTTIRLHVKYDYNVQRADMFSAHAGEVRVFAIDAASNTVVRDVLVNNRDNGNAIAQHPGSQTFYIDFPEMPVGSYRFVAYAQQKPYDVTSAQTASHFDITSPAVNQDVTSLRARLTRSSATDAEGRHAVNAPTCGLDTLWMGNTVRPVEVTPANTGMQLLNDTISMVRDTKYLTLSLHHLDDEYRRQMDDSHYRIEIVDNNGLLGWNNDVLTAEDTDNLLYTPFAQRTSDVVYNVEGNEEIAERVAHYDISFSRLIFHSGANAGKNARLHIIRTDDNSMIADIDLAYILAMGRSAFEVGHYGEQEYLDRAYDYDLHFFLQADSWLYMNLKVAIMAWVIRIQNTVL